MTSRRTGVILPVVLLVLLLLGLLVAMFAFRVNADVAGMRSATQRVQTRLAAEAGIERVKLLLRDHRHDVDVWYDNPDDLHRVIVWTADGDETLWGTNEEFNEERMSYRFSVVADDPTDDEEFIRFGITDESAKLNLNTCTEVQLRKLIEAVAGDEEEEINVQELVDAILDWRDTDSAPRGEAGDTEGEYYRTLPRPYRVKNGPFDTVEELLLVKGVTGQIVYGEDFDRNGLLTPNENDGNQSFPPDNRDGLLSRGLYPYLTVVSAENNVSNDNRPRVYLFSDAETLRQELSLALPSEPQVVEFIITATRSQSGAGNGNNNTGSGGPPGQPGRREQNTGPGASPRGSAENQDGTGGTGTGLEPVEPSSPGGGEASGSESDGADGQNPPMRSPASLLRDAVVDGQSQRSIVTPAHLPVLMDRTTTVRDEVLPGLINVNTAPRIVLRCLDELTEEQVEAILEKRQRLGPQTKATTAWLLTEGVVDLDTFERLSPQITARGQQFRVESLGYADHTGTVTRLEVVLDLVGPIPRTVYYRDVTYLGASFPIGKEDVEKLRAR